MLLTRLLYTSQATRALELTAVRELNDLAQAKNRADGITGLLGYNDPFFVQCLEGPRSVVSRTMERIYRDPRHSAITLIEFAEVKERVFGDWGMKLVLPGDMAPGEFRRVCELYGGVPFSPSRMTVGNALRFLLELAPGPVRVLG